MADNQRFREIPQLSPNNRPKDSGLDWIIVGAGYDLDLPTIRGGNGRNGRETRFHGKPRICHVGLFQANIQEGKSFRSARKTR